MKKLVEIADIIKGKESKTLEFKRDLSSFKPIMRTLIAFANTAGGTIVIGRDDGGEIIGIEDVLQAEERIANAIADSIMPAMMPDIEIFTYETKDLLILRAAHWSGPFYLKNEGPEDGVYVRLGSTNRKAGPEILAELHRTVRRVSFDQEPCPELSEDDLDLAKAESVFKSVNRGIDKHKLESLGLIVPYAGRKTVSILNLNGRNSGLPSGLFFIPIQRRLRAKQQRRRKSWRRLVVRQKGSSAAKCASIQLLSASVRESLRLNKN